MEALQSPPNTGGDPRTHIWPMIRKSHEDAARHGRVQDLCVSADNSARTISMRYTSDHSLALEPLEWQLHELWYIFCVGAKHTKNNDSEQHRLLVQLLTICGLGVVTQRGNGPQVVQELAIKGKRIWADLPLLADDAVDFWQRECGSMSRRQRDNFCSFFARLMAVDILVDPQLGNLALIVLRDTLETPRSLGNMQDDPEVETQNHEKDSLSVAEFLHAANSWLFLAGNKIIKLSEASSASTPEGICTVGELAQQAGVQPHVGGFSTQRWLFWMRRLEEVGHSDVKDGEPSAGTTEFTSQFTENKLSTAAVARGMVNSMATTACESDTSIRRELALNLLTIC